MNKTVNKDLILIGSGGCMRELVWQIQEFNKNSTAWNILGYIDSLPPEKGMSVSIGLQEVPYLGDDDYLLKQSTQINAAICVGSPGLRKKIAMKLFQNPCIQFPNLILGNTQICQDVVFGKGCIVSMDVRISTNVTVGDFVFFNTGSMVCHDGIIGNYVTLAPDVKLAGAVAIGANSELGMGAKVIQGVNIGADAIVGAGAVVVDDIKGNGTFVGVPAHQIHV
jgi:sugar O-acyltransferase (sialic acid O-acetyltransferase NeuD family)